MATTNSGIPLVVIGRNPGTAQAVRRLMVPEFDVVHACFSPEQAIADISRLAQGLKPLDYHENVGSQNYSRIPNNIAFGGGYDHEAIEAIKTAVDKQVDTTGLLWLWPDAEKRVQGGPPPTTPEQFESYASGVVARIKERACQSDFKESQGGVFYY
ncbi:unnamed protein product [Periconia digitata]|uniref:Uncharacterized protein n=1 Tax=Periconia digitata TaxID=1303443 RepID=A0A9W4XMB8_9PLEO|nr:unnamed protein product [Periconia digitata]